MKNGQPLPARQVNDTGVGKEFFKVRPQRFGGRGLGGTELGDENADALRSLGRESSHNLGFGLSLCKCLLPVGVVFNISEAALNVSPVACTAAPSIHFF